LGSDSHKNLKFLPRETVIRTAATMGIDVGFDLYPPLEGPDDAELWSRFLSQVTDTFSSDPCFVELEDCLEFKVGEHPTLYVNPSRFRRFSSKVSGSCGAAESYISQVHHIAKEFFHHRIHFWSEYSDESRPKYTWTEVHAAEKKGKEVTADEDTKATEVSGNTPVLFPDVCGWVLQAWERSHVGMNGLRFVSASFPSDSGYKIVQEEVGSLLSQVNSIEEWADNPNDSLTKKAYWATRVYNNCTTVNVSLLKLLQHVREAGSSVLSIPLRDQTVTITLDGLSLRTVGLSPHHVGTITEPPFVSRVPPSDDGETNHTFVVGLTTNGGTPIALDCSAAQFGVFGDRDEPFLAMPLVPFLRRLGKKHRVLKAAEEQQSSAMLNYVVSEKIETCTQLAIEASRSGQ